MRIADIYQKEGITISKNLSVHQALLKMLQEKHNSFVVLNEHNDVVGVLTLQDIAAATVPQQFRENINMAHALYHENFFEEQCESIKNKSVQEIMRTDFTSVTRQTNIMAIMADFLKNDLYLVPVIEEGKLIGLVTRSDIKCALAQTMNIE